MSGRIGLRYRNDAAGLTVRIGGSGATGDQIAEGVDAIDRLFASMRSQTNSADGPSAA